MKRYAIRLPDGRILLQPTKAQAKRRAETIEQQAYRAMRNSSKTKGKA